MKSTVILRAVGVKIYRPDLVTGDVFQAGGFGAEIAITVGAGVTGGEDVESNGELVGVTAAGVRTEVDAVAGQESTTGAGIKDIVAYVNFRDAVLIEIGQLWSGYRGVTTDEVGSSPDRVRVAKFVAGQRVGVFDLEHVA